VEYFYVTILCNAANKNDAAERLAAFLRQRAINSQNLFFSATCESLTTSESSSGNINTSSRADPSYSIEKIAMSESNKTTQRWVQAFKQSDDTAIGEFWKEHQKQLKRIAARYISVPLKQRFDDQDIAQSAFRSFARQMHEQDFEFDNRNDVANLLFAIAANKAKEKARYHLRQKRGIDQEVYISHLANLDRTEPTPDEQVAFSEILELIGDFAEDEQKIIQLRMDGYSQKDIATQLRCSERTVRRKLKVIQKQLESLID